MLRGVVLVNKDARNCVLVKCDECGKRITDFGWAGVVWTKDKQKDDGFELGKEYDLRILCKSDSCLNSEENRGKPWQELRDTLLYMLENAGMNTLEKIEEVWEDHQFMGSL